MRPRPVRTPEPRISIVTPSLNQAAYLEQTIRSVLLQNYDNLQYVVIDGGSSDGSVDIIKRYSPWLDYWVSEHDRGQSSAINKGLARCDGEWVNWLNSDDYLLPGALHAIARGAEANPVAKLVAGTLRVVSPEGTALRTYGIKLSHDTADDAVNHRMAQPAMFYRRSTGLSPDESLHYAMDYAMWITLLAEHGPGSIEQISDEIAAFRLHAESKTTTSRTRFEDEERLILGMLCKRLGEKPDFIRVLSAPAFSRAVPPLTTGFIRRRPLQRAIVRRYLLGDVRRHFAAGESGKGMQLARATFPVAPLATTSTAVRAWGKCLIRPANS